MANLAHWRRSLKDNVLDESALGESLSPATVDNLCRSAGHRWRKSFWTPRVTLLTFLLQVLDGAKSLRSAVSLLLVHLVDGGEEDLPSCDPSAFCQARQRLPCAVVNGAMVAVANRMRHMLPLLLIPARCQTAKAFALLRQLLAWVAHDVVPDRPNRYEPRRLKRRAKQYTYLVKPRADYKKDVATGAC